MAEIDERKLDQRLAEGPQTALERRYMEEYLEGKGHRLEDLAKLPADEARQLMREACQYAALKLAEVESKVRLRKKIHF